MTTAIPPALVGVLPRLRCPVCAGTLRLTADQVRCEHGHAYDLARQGYLNLVTGRRHVTGDTAAMVLAREAFLAGTHYAPVADALADAVARTTATVGGLVADLAGGTGYYLARVLQELPGWDGACLDVSVPALKRAARAHPRAAAIGADLLGPLPLRDAAADVVLSTFGPRPAAEVERVLSRRGVFVVVAPTADHLRELVGPLGLVSVDEAKDERLAARLAGFERTAVEEVAYELRLAHADLEALVGMGPSAFHVPAEERRRRVAALPDPAAVTVSVRVATYRPRGAGTSGATVLRPPADGEE
ncbi:putative RNA methyltransferase [Georgenia thermotolerans]|uniref:23S rRNA (guanine(745)-N(1))-methyltransferase N-terminal domain-containing protein n=1 Tax=Georgenia thermotolerans TaxID=527326 RepID=A0A7J5UMU7_9MICO|nr:hypothetical protein [Georgenia thermotolerans]KAE8763590.1 hypothetical protein GB883_13450 [Georgenia thermotolerans]